MKKLKQLDFVFIIRLRGVNKTATLAELIINQHDKLDLHDVEVLRSILNGRTSHKVLLLMDGYDEYKPGTNREVDRAIDITQGNCLLLLTSRPGFLKKHIRNKMDGEIFIHGFSEQNMKRCAQLFLGNEQRCSQMLEQAKNSGIDGLLHVPIILLMVCTIFAEEKMLPKRKTDIVKTIFKLAIAREEQKPGNRQIKSTDDILFILGMFSLKALQSEVAQLLLDKVRIFFQFANENDNHKVVPLVFCGCFTGSENIIFLVFQQDELETKLPGIMKLGLLFETSTDAATVKEQRSYVCFVHKMLQDYAAGYFVAKSVEKTDSGV